MRFLARHRQLLNLPASLAAALLLSISHTGATAGLITFAQVGTPAEVALEGTILVSWGETGEGLCFDAPGRAFVVAEIRPAGWLNGPRPLGAQLRAYTSGLRT